MGDKKPLADQNESRLRGAALNGSDQKDAVDHADFAKDRNPDAELHLDGESDRLDDDGLDIEDDSETLAGTHGNVRPG